MDKKLIQIEPRLDCENCGAAGARRYKTFTFAGHGRHRDEKDDTLCVRCARMERLRLNKSRVKSEGISRHELIRLLDDFFETSGVFEICRLCHQQGTGCCPPSCRVMGDAGCDQNNRYGKTVFCSAFVCGALMNTIAECDPEIGRELRWIKREIGPAEFHLFEMITRAPAEIREHERPLFLPESYPAPEGLERGNIIREHLLALTEEVLEIRRAWNATERRHPVDLPVKNSF